MRVNTMRKLLKKIKNVEKETNSVATIDGYLDGFIITLYRYRQPLARSVFNEKWAIDDCMNEFARFEANAFHNARKYAEQREAEEEKEKEFAKCLNNLARFYSNEEMAMFYRIKNIDGVMSAEILLVVRNDSGTTDIIEEVPLNMSVKDFEGKVREICEGAERIKEEK